jgi:membrane-associated HD superfamily phosphohydrolase
VNAEVDVAEATLATFFDGALLTSTSAGILVSILTLTPFVFSGIQKLSSEGSVSTAVVEKGILAFIATVIGLLLSSVIIFIFKIARASAEERKQYRLILIGTLITFGLLFTFNLILPGVFSIVKFIPLGGLFIFPFIAFTGYSTRVD